MYPHRLSHCGVRSSQATTAVEKSQPCLTHRIQDTPGGMKRVTVFGNAGGGKSMLARELAAITGLPLAVVDELQY